MTERKFTDQHEWLELSGTQARVGITAYAQHQLGDVVYVELPAMGRVVSKGEAMAVVESVKAASDVYAPVSGKVIQVNDVLTSQPQLVNENPEDGGWFAVIELTQPDEINQLMDHSQYQTLIGG